MSVVTPSSIGQREDTGPTRLAARSTRRARVRDSRRQISLFPELFLPSPPPPDGLDKALNLIVLDVEKCFGCASFLTVAAKENVKFSIQNHMESKHFEFYPIWSMTFTVQAQFTERKN